MGTGSSSDLYGQNDGARSGKLVPKTSSQSTGSSRSPGLSPAVGTSQDSAGVPYTAALSNTNFSPNRCVDHNFRRPSNSPGRPETQAKTAAQSKLAVPSPPAAAAKPDPDPVPEPESSQPRARYIFSKHSMVFEDEGGAPSNVDERIHRAFKLDMRIAFKGKSAEVVEVCHRMDRDTLIILYRVKHRSKISPEQIGIIADNAQMTVTWQMLDLFREEALSRCNSDASIRKGSSSRLRRRFSCGTFGPLVDSPVETQGAADSSTCFAADGSPRDADPPNFYARYVASLAPEPQRRLSVAKNDKSKRSRPPPVDPEVYVQELHTFTRLQSKTQTFLDDGMQPRRLLRTCRWHALPLPSSASQNDSFRLASPTSDDERVGGSTSTRTTLTARQRHSSDGTHASLSNFNLVSAGSQASTPKDIGIKPAPPILVMNSSFRLDSSTSSLPQFGEGNRYVKLRLPRKTSVSFLLKDENGADVRPPQSGINSVAHNIMNPSSLENSMSLISEYIW